MRSPRRTLCRCSVATTLILVWLISFVTMFPLILFQQIETVKLGDIILHEVCLEKWPSRNLQKIYTLSLTTSQFILPVIVLTIVHLKISLYLNVHLNGPPRSTLCKRGKISVTIYVHSVRNLLVLYFLLYFTKKLKKYRSILFMEVPYA